MTSTTADISSPIPLGFREMKPTFEYTFREDGQFGEPLIRWGRNETGNAEDDEVAIDRGLNTCRIASISASLQLTLVVSIPVIEIARGSASEVEGNAGFYQYDVCDRTE